MIQYLNEKHADKGKVTCIRRKKLELEAEKIALEQKKREI